MLKIGDFSKLTHVSVRMLRYYDSEGLLRPALTDSESSYRLYSAEQVPKLQKIVLLRDLNFGIEEIRAMLQNWNDEYLISQLRSKVEETQARIADEKKRIENIHSAISHIEANCFDQFYNVTLKSIPSYPVISLRRRVADNFEEGRLWGELLEFVSREHIEYDKSSQNNVAVYYDDEYMESGADIEVCLIVKRLGRSAAPFTYRMLEPVENMACMMVYGPYENLAGAYSSFADWLDKNRPYTMRGPSRQVTLIDCHDTSNPSEYLTEIQIPLSGA